MTSEAARAIASHVPASGQNPAIRPVARALLVISSNTATMPISPAETRTARHTAAARRGRSPRVQGQNRRKTSRTYLVDVTASIGVALLSAELAVPEAGYRQFSSGRPARPVVSSLPARPARPLAPGRAPGP